MPSLIKSQNGWALVAFVWGTVCLSNSFPPNRVVWYWGVEMNNEANGDFHLPQCGANFIFSLLSFVITFVARKICHWIVEVNKTFPWPFFSPFFMPIVEYYFIWLFLAREWIACCDGKFLYISWCNFSNVCSVSIKHYWSNLRACYLISICVKSSSSKETNKDGRWGHC